MKCFALLMRCSAWILPFASVARADDKPLNVLMILADDLGWSDTTLNGGNALYETPNLERLAKRGMIFHQAYAASPLCSPTRASILTGQTPARHGITAPTAHIKQKKISFKPTLKPAAPPARKAIEVNSVGPLNPELPTLGKLIKQHGHATGHFGKWHLGHPPHSPLEHGFDVDIPHWAGPGPAGSFLAPWKHTHYDNGKPGEHIEDRMAAEASKWIKEQAKAGKPFYAQYWQFSVHAPFDAKPELIAKYAKKVDPAKGEVNKGQRSPTYAAMVQSLDDAVGTLLDALDEAGVSENTLIIFTSDNGGNEYNLIFERDGKGKGFLARPTDNIPLRGGKATMYEGGIRVPTVIAWPGVVKPASQSEARIQSTDLYPTLLNALGIKMPDNHPIDGIDIAPALSGKELKRSGGMITYFPHSPGVPQWLPPSVAVHEGDWKLIRLFHEGEDGAHRHLLYNLKEDIGEITNLAAKHAVKVKQLDALIQKHLDATKAVVPKANPRFNPELYKPEEIGVQKSVRGKLASRTMSPEDMEEAKKLVTEEFGEEPAKPKNKSKK